MRVLGIDFGSKRTGLALADTDTRLPTPFALLQSMTKPQLIDAIRKIILQEDIDIIVAGVPLNVDGSAGPQAKEIMALIAMLERATGRPVIQVDERLTSHHAESKLAGHFTRAQKRRRVDAIAAARILQDFLDAPATDIHGTR